MVDMLAALMAAEKVGAMVVKMVDVLGAQMVVWLVV